MLHLTSEPNESLKLETRFSQNGEMQLNNFCQNVLQIEFKLESKPIFMKYRPVPFAIQDDLARAYDAGIARGVCTPT